MSEHWFIHQSRKEAKSILDHTQMSRESKRELLNLLAARVDGASLMLNGEPELFRALCDFRNEVKRLRDEIH